MIATDTLTNSGCLFKQQVYKKQYTVYSIIVKITSIVTFEALLLSIVHDYVQ